MKKKLNKKIFLVASIIFVFNIFFVSTVLAVDFTPSLQVNFGNSSIDFKSVTCTKGENCSIGWIGQYVGALYNYGIGLAVILAIVMIMVGGFVWLLSAGSPDKVKTAKDFITSSITGLSLALFSFIILQAVNPNLVSFNSLNVASPQEIEGSGDVQYYGDTSEPPRSDSSTPTPTPTSPGSVDTEESNVAETFPNDNLFWETSGDRNDGTRHDDGHSSGNYHNNVTDYHYDPNSPTTQHVLNNGELLTGADDPTWGTAYRMPDGSVWVKEPGGSTGFHWHVETPVEGWTWIANH